MINIIKLYTTWCAPCKMLTPILEKIQIDFKDKISIQEVNIDNNVPELYSDMNIVSTPTLLFIKDGKLLEKVSGFKSYDELKNIIEKLLKEE